MDEHLTLFLGAFTTLLALIDPLEALPISLQLLHVADEQTNRQIAFRSCLYATLLMFFFLIFGTPIMRLFEVPLSMVRLVGGIILMRLGFELFANRQPGEIIKPASTFSVKPWRGAAASSANANRTFVERESKYGEREVFYGFFDFSAGIGPLARQ